MQHHTRPDLPTPVESFPIDPVGLPEAGRPELLELGPGDTLDLTEVPGLYFLGLSWQHTRGSALLGFVSDDAAYLADRIA
jgi:hypothetical protein